MASLCPCFGRRSHIQLPSDDDTAHNFLPPPRFTLLNTEHKNRGSQQHLSIPSPYYLNRRLRPRNTTPPTSSTITEEGYLDLEEDSTLSTYLLPEKEGETLIVETEVVLLPHAAEYEGQGQAQEETTAQEETRLLVFDDVTTTILHDAASQRSSTVSLPSTRVTSMASSMYTGRSRTSEEDQAPPPAYTRSDHMSMPTHTTLPQFQTQTQTQMQIQRNPPGLRITAGDLYRDIQRRIASNSSTSQPDSDYRIRQDDDHYYYYTTNGRRSSKDPSDHSLL